MKRQYRISEGRVQEAPDGEGQILVFLSLEESERRYLVDTLQIDEHTLQSAQDPDELSRIEFEPQHIAIIFKRPRTYSGKDQLLFRVTSQAIFLFRERVIIVLGEDVPVFDGKYFSRLASLKELTLKVIYRSIFHFLEHLRVINMIAEELESKVNVSMDNRYIINLFALEKSLVYYLNAITSNEALIERLKNNAAKIGLNQEEVEFLDDMYVENNQCYRQAEIYSNILASLMDARASVVGNNLNVIMKTLTIITIGIMVPTFVVSAFSMNVKIPFEDHPRAFYAVMALALTSVLTVMLVWKRKRW